MVNSTPSVVSGFIDERVTKAWVESVSSVVTSSNTVDIAMDSVETLGVVLGWYSSVVAT